MFLSHWRREKIQKKCRPWRQPYEKEWPHDLYSACSKLIFLPLVSIAPFWDALPTCGDSDWWCTLAFKSYLNPSQQNKEFPSGFSFINDWIQFLSGDFWRRMVDCFWRKLLNKDKVSLRQDNYQVVFGSYTECWSKSKILCILLMHRVGWGRSHTYTRS